MKVGAWGCSGLGEGRVGGMNKMVLGGHLSSRGLGGEKGFWNVDRVNEQQRVDLLNYLEELVV